MADPLIELLLGLINQINNGTQEKTYTPTQNNIDYTNDWWRKFFGLAAEKSGNTIPEEFWLKLFGTNNNNDTTPAADKKTVDTTPAADKKTVDTTPWQPGQGGQTLNPDYTDLYGDKPYEDYFKEFMGSETARWQKWKADFDEYYKTHPVTDLYLDDKGNPIAPFEYNKPIPQWKTWWKDPTGTPDYAKGVDAADYAPGGKRNNPTYNAFGQGGPIKRRKLPGAGGF